MSATRALSHGLLALALTAAAVGAAAAEQPARPSEAGEQLLRYRFVQGESVRYQSRFVERRAEPDADEPLVTSLTLASKRTTRAVAPRHASATFELEHTGATLDVARGGARAPADQVAAMARRLEDVVITRRITPRGEPRSAAVSRLAADLRPLWDTLRLGQSVFEPIFPEDALTPGDTWRQRSSLELHLGAVTAPIELDVVYTYLGVDPGGPGRDVRIGVEVALRVPATPVGSRRERLTLKGSGHGSGSLRFDPVNGRLVSGAVELSRELVLEPAGGDPERRQRTRVESTHSVDLMAP